MWLFEVGLGPPLPVALAAAALAWVVVLLGSRRSLEAADLFPELARLPLIGRLVAGGGAR